MKQRIMSGMRPTGKLHLGHAWQAALGDSICNLLEEVGYDVTREYYVNDAGVQILKLSQSIFARYQQALGLDVKFPEDGYHGKDIIEFIPVSSLPETADSKTFYLCVNPTKVEIPTLTSNKVTSLTNNITKLTDPVGEIIYTLYRGNIKVASAKFEASMVHKGTPVTRSWLVIDKLVHTGTTETKTITVQPKIETGNSGADNDLTATINCRYLGEVKPDGTLGDPSDIPSENIERDSTTGAVLLKCPFKNQDIEIKAKHGTSVYETEIITYIPQDTPGLDLDNDGDFIPYTPSGNKIGTSTVKSKARLLLNQEEISDITYTWTLDGCVLKDDEDEVKLTTFTGPTIEIEYLTKERATATCKVTYLGKEYSKTFSIVKQISAASYWLSVSQPVHTGKEQDVAITVRTMKKEGLVVEVDDTSAILYYRFKNDETWTRSSSYNLEILSIFQSFFKFSDIFCSISDILFSIPFTVSVI